jgi:hypothetical protein
VIFGIASRRERGDRQPHGRLVLTPDLRQTQMCAGLARRVAPHHVGRMPERRSAARLTRQGRRRAVAGERRDGQREGELHEAIPERADAPRERQANGRV